MNDRSHDQRHGGGNRRWKKADRAKVSIMHVFRSAHDEHDAKKKAVREGKNPREITSRSKVRREGVSEDELRRHLEADLRSLLNTIRLDSIEPLDDYPHVRASVVNYGFQDLSNVSSADLGKPDVVNSIRQSLIDHEPRMIAETIDIQVTQNEGGTQQRLSLTVSAELVGDPVDIGLDFEADVDLGTGKMRMSQIRVDA